MKNDFTNFSAKLYLKEYYSKIGEENKFLLNFLHKTYNSLPNLDSYLEIGGGPCIWQLISAIKKVNYVVFSEFAQDNRKEVIKFLNKDQNAFNWSAYIKYVLKLEGNPTSEKEIEQVKDIIRNKIAGVVPCDVFKKNPFEPSYYKQFDILSMQSVVEPVASNEEEFILGMTNAMNFLKQDGYLVSFFSKNSKKWTHGDTVYYTFPIDENYIDKFLPRLGLSILERTSAVGADYQQDYEGIFCVLAKKIS